MAIDPDLFAEALAEIRGLRMKPSTPEQPKPKPARQPRVLQQPCCRGDRTGYQQHKKYGEEACEASKAAEAPQPETPNTDRDAQHRPGRRLPRGRRPPHHRRPRDAAGLGADLQA